MPSTDSVQLRNTGLALGVAAVAGGAWWFSDRAPYPYSQHRLLDLQLPILTNTNLDRLLRPRPGERMLEIGPGTGLQAVHIAPQLGALGQLDILDIQQEMLTHTMDREDLHGSANVVPYCADARELPFESATFDAVYLMTALGEIPDPAQVLAETARVLKPGGRLVVGEFFDRHWIRPGRLQRMAAPHRLHLTERLGPGLAYLARFERCTC